MATHAFRTDGTRIGTVLMIFAALFYSGMSISIKLSAADLTVWQTAMGRFALGAGLIPILARSLRFDLLGRQRGWLVFRGFSATGSFLMIIQALKTIPLSVCMVLFYLWPAFCCLLSAWIAGEPTTKKEWPFVIGALCGAMLILWPDRFSLRLEAGHAYALGASFLSGLAVILIRRLGRVNNPFTIYYYFCMIGGLICIWPLLFQDAPILPVSRVGWFGFIAVALLAITAQILMTYGMKYLNASKTGVLMMIEPVAATTFGTLYLAEPLSFRFICGAGLIFGCGLFLILLPTRSGESG